MRKLPIFTLCVIALVATSALARPSQDNASVVGNWDITIESPQGKRTSLLEIKQDGGKLTGVIKSPRGERPLDSLSVKGNDITFAMTIKFQDQDMIISYRGKVEKGAMAGEADFGGMASGPWSAVPHKADAAPAPGPAPATAPAAGQSAMNITGVWSFDVQTSAGVGNPVFTLKQDGENVTGTYKGPLGEAPVTGTVKGSDVKLSFKVSMQGQDLVVTYTGKINAADSMGGKVVLGELGEGTWTGKKKP